MKTKKGRLIFMDVGCDNMGRWWWKTERAPHKGIHGPFASEKEAQRNGETTMFGNAEIKDGGQIRERDLMWRAYPDEDHE